MKDDEAFLGKYCFYRSCLNGFIQNFPVVIQVEGVLNICFKDEVLFGLKFLYCVNILVQKQSTNMNSPS